MIDTKKIMKNAKIKSAGFNVQNTSQIMINLFVLILLIVLGQRYTYDTIIVYVLIQLIFWIILKLWFVPFTYKRELNGHLDFLSEIKTIKEDNQATYQLLLEIKSMLKK